MLLGNGLLPHFGIAGGGGLLGATWARDGSGRAYNTPTLGSELLTNPDFETFSEGQATGWTKIGTPTLAQETTIVFSGNSSQKINSASTGQVLSQYVAGTGARWLQWRTAIYGTSGVLRSVARANAYVAVLGDSAGANWVSYVYTSRDAVATNGIYYQHLSGTLEAYVDSSSLKVLSLPTLHAYCLGTSSAQIAAARINALTSGTQAGAFALVDNPASPANGIYAYHDGTGVTLDKLVAGTWSNVIARVTVAFSADADVEIRPLGSNQFDLYYGGTKQGTTATISDASIVSNLYYGLFSTYSGNTFTRFTLDGNVVPFGF